MDPGKSSRKIPTFNAQQVDSCWYLEKKNKTISATACKNNRYCRKRAIHTDMDVTRRCLKNHHDLGKANQIELRDSPQLFAQNPPTSVQKKARHQESLFLSTRRRRRKVLGQGDGRSIPFVKCFRERKMVHQEHNHHHNTTGSHEKTNTLAI